MGKSSSQVPEHMKVDYPIPPPTTKFPVTNYLAREGRNSPRAYDKMAEQVGGKFHYLGSSLDSSVESRSSSRVSSPMKSRLVTPPTPSLSNDGYNKVHLPIPTKPEEIYRTDEENILHFLEPSPVGPPDYDTLPPGGCPRYPVTLNDESPDCLPGYSPAVYKIGLVLRKMEWITPYEPSPIRSWKLLIMELNSTQLNFYNIPSLLENNVLQFKPSCILEQNKKGLSQRGHCLNQKELLMFNSYLTTEADLEFYKYCNRLDLLEPFDSPLKSLNINDEDMMKLSKSKGRKLVRSYSLQLAKLGLATDYKKKVNVLRLRIESEQNLISFATVGDLIDWNNAINTAKDLAMDILERELPIYRTVPRRRRRSAHDLQLAIARSTADLNKSDSNIKQKLSKFRSKIGLRSRNNSTKNTLEDQINTASNKPRSVSLPYISTSNLNSSRIPARTDSVNERMFDEELDNDDDEEEDDELINGINGVHDRDDNEEEEEEEEDIQDMSDLQQSDDEEDDYISDEDLFRIRRRRDTIPSSIYSSADDVKWNPPPKQSSLRKYYKNCIRCIKPLNANDKWVFKSIVKPTTLSPLSLAYLRSMHFYEEMLSYSCESGGSSSTTLASSAYKYSNRKRNFSFRDMNTSSFADAPLTRIPNHFLKEHIVGSHGLIPKEI